MYTIETQILGTFNLVVGSSLDTRNKFNSMIRKAFY